MQLVEKHSCIMFTVAVTLAVFVQFAERPMHPLVAKAPKRDGLGTAVRLSANTTERLKNVEAVHQALEVMNGGQTAPIAKEPPETTDKLRGAPFLSEQKDR
jgi:hypothetical protein